ncbi:uncharacterized protein LOC142906260 [Petromyzon marinus]|uniref:uncharacterized protein LOC142906260 n=1 Tax=Petromyzon marinus TaxID=7757 RepID=UPI003F703453
MRYFNKYIISLVIKCHHFPRCSGPQTGRVSVRVGVKISSGVSKFSSREFGSRNSALKTPLVSLHLSVSLSTSPPPYESLSRHSVTLSVSLSTSPPLCESLSRHSVSLSVSRSTPRTHVPLQPVALSASLSTVSLSLHRVSLSLSTVSLSLHRVSLSPPCLSLHRVSLHRVSLHRVSLSTVSLSPPCLSLHRVSLSLSTVSLSPPCIFPPCLSLHRVSLYLHRVSLSTVSLSLSTVSLSLSPPCLSLHRVSLSTVSLSPPPCISLSPPCVSLSTTACLLRDLHTPTEATLCSDFSPPQVRIYGFVAISSTRAPLHCHSRRGVALDCSTKDTLLLVVHSGVPVFLTTAPDY